MTAWRQLAWPVFSKLQMFIDGVNNNSYKPHPSHFSIRNGIEINASLMVHLRDLRKFVDGFNPDVLHITDSAGPMMGLIKKLFADIPMTITKPTIRMGKKRTGSLYRYYVKKSLDYADRIITFTSSAAEELQGVDIPPERITVIPWGIKCPRCDIRTETWVSIRTRYGCRPGELFIVVADRVSASSVEQMIKNLEILSMSNEVRFVVAIRPTRFQHEYAKLSSRAVVVESGSEDFYDLLSAADVMLSPVRTSAANSTSLLPLTWIEAMGRKTPVITMPGPGVEDLIKDGETGFLYNSLEDLTAIFTRLGNLQYLHHCQNKARQIVKNKYDIGVIARDYRSVWNELA